MIFLYVEVRYEIRWVVIFMNVYFIVLCVRSCGVNCKEFK